VAFNLEAFEHYCYSRRIDLAARELLALLQEFDTYYGKTGQQFHAHPMKSVVYADRELHIWSRAAAAAACLLSDPTFQVSPDWQLRLLLHHRWLSALFAATPLVSLDPAMRALNLNEDDHRLEHFNVSPSNLFKLCLMYSPESEVNLDLDALWEASPVWATSLGLALLSPRFSGSLAAHSKRELLLPWLTKKLPLVDDLDVLPVGVLHDAYMHCSYADRADKHDIKRAINQLLVRKMRQHGLQDVPARQLPPAANGKPLMLVVLEWFTHSHSIYRTHSLTLESARKQFHVVAMGYTNCMDEVTSKVFDEVIPIQSSVPMIDQLRQISTVARERRASVLYMPSVGMFPLTMWLSNLRVAPLQLVALGHPATTHSHVIDRVVVEADYVGDSACFSEELLVLPADGMPYRPPVSMQKVDWTAPVKRSDDGRVHIAVCATTMKLNPGFLAACRQIQQRTQGRVHFEFLIGQAIGVVYPAVVRITRQFLGDAVTVYPHQDYASYISIIRGCDMFMNPFPFGNTNGIVDTVAAGLIGVCMTGPEVHSHIDQGLFDRLKFPSWLTASTPDSYIDAVVRLVDNPAERRRLAGEFCGLESVQKIFNGDAEKFGKMVLLLMQAVSSSKCNGVDDSCRIPDDHRVA